MVGDTGNIFLFPAISLPARSEATLVDRRWYTDLDRSTLTAFTENHRPPTEIEGGPIIGWEAAVSIPDQWVVFLEVILETEGVQPAVYKLSMLIEVAAEFSARLR